MRLLVILAALVFGACSVQPPALVDPSGPADFDHRAAWKTLEELAVEPHPIGSAAHGRARDLVLAKLSALGLEPEVQRAVGLNGQATTAGQVQNIVARLDPPGASTEPAILLVTHYDSRIAAHGAGDDAAAVAALIDVMRALKSGPPLARPVIFLCTDGEEQGLLGAEAFVSQHALAKSVGVVLNFEARGTRGPALLFETSVDSGGLVRAAAEVVPGLTGTSLAGAVYRTMPNDTDLSVFLRGRFAGLNFAFNQGWAQYHTKHDDPAHVDPRSMAHHGRIALALVRRLGGPGPLPAPAADEVYFNLLPRVFVVYNLAVAQAIGAFLVLALVCALWLHAGGAAAVARATALALVGLAMAVLWGVAVALAARYLHGTVLGVGDALRSRWYHAAVVLGAAELALRASRQDAAARAVAALLIWTALAVATALKFAPASYLFAWPPLLALPGLLRVVRGGTTGWFAFVERAVVPAPALILLGSTLILFFESLGNDVVGSGVTGLLTALTVLLVAPLVEIDARAANRVLILSLLACVASPFMTQPSATKPDQVWLAYGLDANTRTARWLALPRKPNPWVAAHMGASPEIGPYPAVLVPRARAPVAHGPAPATDLAGPEIQLVKEEPESGGRALSLRVTSPRGASLFWLALPAQRVRAVTLDGRALPRPGIKAWGDMPGRFDRRRADPAADYTIEMCGVGRAGFELKLSVAEPGPLPIRICDVTGGVPAGDPVPDTLVPYDFGLCTVVACTLTR